MITLRSLAHLLPAFFLLTACSVRFSHEAASPPSDVNRIIDGSAQNEIQNGTFEHGFSPWSFHVGGSARATHHQDASTVYGGTSASEHIRVTRATPNSPWNVQLRQNHIPITRGQTVTVSFWAKASSSRNLQYVIQQSDSPYDEYAHKDLTIGARWKTYTFQHVLSDEDSAAFFAFNLGGAKGDIWIGGVSVTSNDGSGATTTGTSTTGSSTTGTSTTGTSTTGSGTTGASTTGTSTTGTSTSGTSTTGSSTTGSSTTGSSTTGSSTTGSATTGTSAGTSSGTTSGSGTGTTTGSSSLPPPIAGTSYHVVWSDEFNGNAVDTSHWNLTGPWDGKPVSSTGSFSYDASRVSEANGIVRITAERNGSSWQGGILSTDSTYQFQYGYVEVRAKLPAGQGFWPAIWLYGGSTADELDIMEFLGGDVSSVYQTYHFPGGQHQVAPSANDWTTSYHTFAMKWEPGKMTYYIDDVATKSWTDSVPARRMYLMLNFDVGGSGDWGGGSDGSTPSPAYFDIDYARVYQP